MGPGQSWQKLIWLCIRNDLGDLIHAESSLIGISTNMRAETRAVKEALNYCVDQVWDFIQVETDSLAVKNILNKNWQVPWEIIDLVEEIFKIIRVKHIEVIHSYREANQLADYIANLAVHSEQKHVLHHLTNCQPQLGNFKYR